MRFGVLGPLAVWAADGAAVHIPEAKVRALLADLLASAGRPVSVDRIVEDLWPDALPAKPAAAVQTKVWQLRRALEGVEPGGRTLVSSGPSGYAIDADLDAHHFEDLLTQARQTGEPKGRAELLARALDLWRGTAYADFDDAEFARPEILRLTELRLLAVEEHAEARLELGEHRPILGDLGALVAEHPLRERLRTAYIRALYAAGRQSEALESYRDLRDRLREELGVDPAPELAQLQEAILNQAPVLRIRKRSNLPAPLTELVGRTDAVARVKALLDDGSRRLVTLTGPGGVGKTRLALETAAHLVEVVPDGVWLAELSGVNDSAGIVDTVATALEIRDDATPSGPSDPAVRVVDALRTKQSFLILDNCEHVIESAAELADRLLRACPGMRLLTTSREPLNIAGEAVWAVPPLDPPAASRLFAARAADGLPGFAVDRDNAEAVAAICRRLDGIPLALELAATRVRSLDVGELADRLDDRFRVLDGGRRGAPDRQQTLRAMIDWSWELLPEPERVVLRRLAVHADGCTLEAAEAVCAGPGHGADRSGDALQRSSVLPLLANLVDRSLVTVVRGASGTRYHLLESVAAYCVERLEEAGEFGRLARRHADYYTGFAEEAERQLRGHEQRDWLGRLDLESANLRVALDRVVQGDVGDVALRLVNALAWYWFLRGRLTEGRRALRSALSAASDTERGHEARVWEDALAMWAGSPTEGDPFRLADSLDDRGRRARVTWFLSLAVNGRGDVSANVARIDRVLAEFRRLADRWGTAAALAGRAEQAILHGDLDGTARDAAESLALFGELGDDWGRLQAMHVLAKRAEITEDYDEAARLQREGLGIAEGLGLWPQASYMMSGLGRIALLTGDYETADRLHERARRLAADRSEMGAEQFAEVGLALGARRRGRLDAAERHLGRWVGWLDEVSGDAGTALVKAELGFIAELRGDATAALRLHGEGLAAARSTGDPRALALCLEGLAGAEALAGRHEKAARLLGTASAVRESVGLPLPAAERGDVERITTTVRNAVDSAAFTRCFGEGRAARSRAHP